MNKRFANTGIVASVNVPTGYPGPEHDDQCVTIRNFVEDPNTSIMVNRAYEYLVDRFDRVGRWPSRAGFFNRFWFDDAYVAMEFQKLTNGTLEIPPILRQPSKITCNEDGAQ